MVALFVIKLLKESCVLKCSVEIINLDILKIKKIQETFSSDFVFNYALSRYWIFNNINFSLSLFLSFSANDIY